MDNKIFTTVIILVVAVAVGLSVVSRQDKSPMMHQILQNQTEIMRTVNGLKSDMNSDLEYRMKNLEIKIAQLENKLRAAAVAPAPAPTPAPAQQRPPAPDPNIVHDIPVADTPVIGAKNAKVTITEFVDFECPFCARFHPPVQQALDAYPNDVNVLLKHFPLSFHPNAKPASKAALAAGEQGKYGEMATKLLANGRSLNMETFKKLAGEIGINVSKFEADLKNNDAKYEQIIQNDIALGGKVGVRGTPSFYINGKTTFARDFNALKGEIDKILGK